MTDVVLDSSAVVAAMVGTEDVAVQVRQLVDDAVCHAPHLVDAEVGNVLRRQVLSGAISEDVARAALHAMPTLIHSRYPHAGPLAEAAWALRQSATFYEALYVALAALLDAPLVTADARLARAPALPCRVRVVARG